MKPLFLTAVILLTSSFAHASEDIKISEPLLWEALHAGNYSWSYRMIHNRPTNETNDEILSQFMMAYLYYKQGKSDEEIVGIIKGVDEYVNHYYFPASKE